jgi:hypothetical protein
MSSWGLVPQPVDKLQGDNSGLGPDGKQWQAISCCTSDLAGQGLPREIRKYPANPNASSSGYFLRRKQHVFFKIQSGAHAFLQSASSQVAHLMLNVTTSDYPQSNSPDEGMKKVSKVWLITGSSRGLGRSIAEAVLAHGDQLVATTRAPRHLMDLTERHGKNERAVALDVKIVSRHAKRSTWLLITSRRRRRNTLQM